MSGRDLAPPIEDPELPALALALDTSAMAPRIAAALGVAAGGGCAVEVLTHKPGKRAVLRYALDTPGGVRRAVAKLYRYREQGEVAFERMRALRNALAEPDVVPEALAFDPELRMLVQAHVDAVDVRHALAAGEGERPLVLAARFLASLHATRPLDGLKTLDAEEATQKTSVRVGRIAAHVPERADVLRSTEVSLRERAPHDHASREHVLIHKDFYYAHVLWDGARIAVVDLDELHMGDPAFDVAHFAAHLRNLAYRQTGNPDAYAREGETFLAAYDDAAPLGVRDRLPFYRAYTFVKLAATEVSRKREGWRTRAVLLSDLAAQALT